MSQRMTNEEWRRDYEALAGEDVVPDAAFRLIADGHRARARGAQLEAENKALREALEEYGQHGPACMAGLFEPRPDGMEPWVRRGPCDCGLDDARAALRTREGSEK